MIKIRCYLLYNQEGVTRGRRIVPPLPERPVSHLGQVGGLANTVDATERHHIRPVLPLGVQDITQDIHAALGLQDLHQGLLQRLLHRRRHRWGRKNDVSHLGDAPEPQNQERGDLLVNVPITFPSSFFATDSQSCTAISAATFFALR